MKKRTYSFLSFAALLFGCSVPKPEYGSINDYPIPMEEINELTYAADKSTFKLWSPDADSVILRIYAEGEGGEPLKTLKMKRQPEGLWKTIVKEYLKGLFYTFSIKENGSSGSIRMSDDCLASRVMSTSTSITVPCTTSEK